MAWVSVLAPMVALSYPSAIVIAKEQQEVRSLTTLSALVILLMSALMLIGVFIIRDVFYLGWLDSLGANAYWIPFAALLLGAYQIVEQSMIRKESFSVLAKSTLYSSVIDSCAKVVAGVVAPLGGVLVGLHAVHKGYHALMVLFFERKKVNMRSANFNVDKIEVIGVAKRYSDFAVYRAPQLVINGISQSIPVLLLASYFGVASAGLFTLAKTAMGIPSALLGKAVGDVFYGRVTRLYYEGGDVFGFLVTTVALLSILGFLPFLIISMYGSQIFSLVFGGEWGKAGEYAAWLSFWFFFVFINGPCIKVIPILRLQKLHLSFTILTLVVRVVGLVAMYYVTKDDVMAVMAFSMIALAGNVALMLYVFYRSSKLGRSVVGEDIY